MLKVRTVNELSSARRCSLADQAQFDSLNQRAVKRGLARLKVSSRAELAHELHPY